MRLHLLLRSILTNVNGVEIILQGVDPQRRTTTRAIRSTFE